LNYIVRRLMPADAAVYRDIRFEALQSAPEAFSSTLEEETSLVLADFAELTRRSQVYAVFAGPEAVGMASLKVATKRKTRHRGEIWGMYVQESHRGTGAASALLNGLMSQARGAVSQLELNVVAVNDRAISFYQNHGFNEVGRIPSAARGGDGFLDEIVMVCLFTVAGDGPG
jgi:ribosomal protein S18 acetylase RimI-like enzyme